jgi:predicted lipoprotein with Yx(FWY)xxD motif
MRLQWATVLAVGALVTGGCGGGDAGEQESASSDVTVSVANVEGVGDVLVDAEGAALYASEQESNGVVRCVGSCAAIWLPLTVEGAPTGGEELEADLGVVERDDGTRQVSFDRRPLYTFIEDTAEGVVTGNGLSDSFDEQELTWHVMTPDGPSTSSANSEKPADGQEPYSGGDYGR